MSAWLPTLKTILPYLTTIVTAAVPAFSARQESEQIAELQQAVRRNTESVKLLAEQLQRAIQAIEASAVSTERRLRRAQIASFLAAAIAMIALCAALLALWGR